MEKIWVEKGGQSKQITKLAFELMGGEKSGWTPITGDLPFTPLSMPDTGQKAPKNQPVQNQAKAKVEQVVENEAPEEIESSSPADFKAFAKEQLTRASIKNFLDGKKVKYKQSATDNALIILLAETLNNNIESLKTEFGL